MAADSRSQFIQSTVERFTTMLLKLSRERERQLRVLYQRIIRDGEIIGANVVSLNPEIDALIEREGVFVFFPSAEESESLEAGWNELNARIMDMLESARLDLQWDDARKQLGDVAWSGRFVRDFWVSDCVMLRMAVGAGAELLRDGNLDRAVQLAQDMIRKLQATSDNLINPPLPSTLTPH